jgi:Protein of unknown function (DUF3572)
MRRTPNHENAETIALNALSFLAESPDALESFMRQSGVDPTTIRLRAAERDFLAAVLDFLMADEVLLVRFCDSTQTEPRAVKQANYQLGGTL